MEDQRETASSVNEEAVVELSEESDKLIAKLTTAELFAESDESAVPDEPTKPEEIQSSSLQHVPKITNWEPVLEFSADPRAQFQENSRMVATGPLNSGFKASTGTAICIIIHHLVTQQNAESIPLAISMIALAIIFRIFYVPWRANSHAKTKYVFKGDWLTGFGRAKGETWKIRISDMERATLISDDGSRKSLVLTTSSSTSVLRGLEDPEKLLHSLPKEIQVDTSELKQKLQQFADSTFVCNDADETALLRDTEQLQLRIKEFIQEFPNARVLKQDFSQIVTAAIATTLIGCGCLAVAYFGYAKYALPFLAIMIFAFLPTLLYLQKTVNCLYVFSPDALFELNRKGGLVHAISLDRVSIHGSQSGFEMHIDNRIQIPVRVENADSEYVKRCLKKYPSE